MAAPIELHLFQLSQPARATRVFLEVTGIPHVLHHVNMAAGEHLAEGYPNKLHSIPFVKVG